MLKIYIVVESVLIPDKVSPVYEISKCHFRHHRSSNVNFQKQRTFIAPARFYKKQTGLK